METRHYSDYFVVPENYKANMTREAINETLDTWLDFYPHEQYIDFLNTLSECISKGSKSVWLTGNYGTGKSNATLVTQKLFMDDEVRVHKWFNDFKNVIKNRKNIEETIFRFRDEGTLVVYDYNASGVDPHEGFIVRLEKAIIAALEEYNYKVPAGANIDSIIERVKREGDNFFKTRDSMQSDLAYLNPQIKTVEDLIEKLKLEHQNSSAPTNLIADVQAVFHKDSIYLNIDATSFRNWIHQILKENKLKRVILIFDEFSEFIDANKDQLKTFEDITENPGISNFYLVPVTHLSMNAFWSENSAGARKATDRFYSRNLQMPNDTAFQLAAHAMKEIPKMADEWKNEKDELWNNIKAVVDKFSDKDVRRQSFYNILPIHPMAAFLLKFLSESARSNQRSIFEYLKGSADGREFQDFIHSGGPAIVNKQYLTVDYLWKYFIERDDLGLNKGIIDIKSEYERICAREFSNKDDDDEDIRVLKAVMLFCLMDLLSPNGHERLRPTVENVDLSFKGDGALTGVKNIVHKLAEKHCFSVVDGNINLYTASADSQRIQEKAAELKFNDLLCECTKNALEDHTKPALSKFSSDRFDFRVSDIQHTTLSNITSTTRKKYSIGKNEDNGTICLWFVIAKNKQEQLQVSDKIHSILKQLHDHRILFFSFPNTTFCSKNINLWNDYSTLYASYMLETDETAKEQSKRHIERIQREWFAELKQTDQVITMFKACGPSFIKSDEIKWANLTEILYKYLTEKMPYCPDTLGVASHLPITALGNNGLKNWALAGLQFDFQRNGPQKQLIDGLKKQGITTTDAWFAEHQDTAFVQIRNLFAKKIGNTISKGTSLSVRKVYIELQRAPYGLKYNGLSAFTLGVALSNILEKNYQWTNDQLTFPLDSETLAEIIESVVKNDGQGEIKGEKLICRLSKEDKAFIEKGPSLFGLVPKKDATVEKVLLQIQEHIEKTSCKVPLWILHEYINTIDDPYAKDINDILDLVCDACRVSSKGKIEDRTEAVRQIGTKILDLDNLPEAVSKYIAPENFIVAFQRFVDKNKPELNNLAIKIGDNAKAYCEAILNKTASTAGLLWKEADISNEINETYLEYQVIEYLQNLLDIKGFAAYSNIIFSLKKSINNCNVPQSIIITHYPATTDLFSELNSSCAASKLLSNLKNNDAILRQLFFTDDKKEIIELVKKQLGNTTLTDEIIKEALESIPHGYTLDETNFVNQIRKKIEENKRLFAKDRLKKAWLNYSGSNTPEKWARDNNMPVKFILSEFADSDVLLRAINDPDTFSVESLLKYADDLSENKAPDISICQQRFLSAVIPTKYSKFGISLTSVIQYMKKKYGEDPNIWEQQPDIDSLIKEQYMTVIAPKIVKFISDASPDELKDKLIVMAKDNFEIGLLFLKD